MGNMQFQDIDFKVQFIENLWKNGRKEAISINVQIFVRKRFSEDDKIGANCVLIINSQI